jgi:hypothetical protein
MTSKLMWKTDYSAVWRSAGWLIRVGLNGFVLGGLSAVLLVRQLLLTIMARLVTVTAQAEILNVLDHLLPYVLGYGAAAVLMAVITLTAVLGAQLKRDTTAGATPRRAHWMTRVVGLMVNTFFGAWLWLILRNEDAPSHRGWLVVGCLVACMLAVAASWRWPRAGGIATLAGAAGLAAAAMVSSVAAGLGVAGAGVALMYAVPFVVTGCLALMDAGSAPAERRVAAEEGGGA